MIPLMLGIKKKGRQQAARLHRIIGENVAPYFLRLSSRLRIAGRTRLFRRWGRNNPKKVVSFYAGFVVVVLTWNILGLVGVRSIPESHKDPLRLAEMSSVSNPFEGMAAINRNREVINNSVSELAQANAILAHRLDSLLRLESMTRKDSLEIVDIYTRLNIKTDNSNEP